MAKAEGALRAYVAVWPNRQEAVLAWLPLGTARVCAHHRSLRQCTARSGSKRSRAAVRAPLHTGTSCVDYSTLNNEKKTLHDGGESSQTFFGMFEWVKKATPTPRHSTA